MTQGAWSSDQYHPWAKEQFGLLRQALITCEAVIAETEYLVPGSGPLLMEMVRRGTLKVFFMLPNEAEPLAALMRHYAKMQFVDAGVVHLSATIPNSLVDTTDQRGFTIYLRRRNEPIKFIAP